MVLLRITYRLRAHHMAEFERIFKEEIAPVFRERGLRFVGIWRTLVGFAGEYMELWEFSSAAEFERQWPGLLNDPRIQAVFKTTGPMVDNENFTLLEPVSLAAGAGGGVDSLV